MITVTVDPDELKALLSFVPVDKLGYTSAGERAYGAYQALQRAVNAQEQAS